MKPDILRIAQNDLKEIHEHLFEFGENPMRKFKASFVKFCSQVSDMPFMFNQYKYNNSKYRCAVIAFGYLVFYQVEEGSKKVKIYRVLHGKRNMAPLLYEEGDSDTAPVSPPATT